VNFQANERSAYTAAAIILAADAIAMPSAASSIFTATVKRKNAHIDIPVI
jgi:hypothetical protein